MHKYENLAAIEYVKAVAVSHVLTPSVCFIGCNYVLHSMSQIKSHCRKHERRDIEFAYRQMRDTGAPGVILNPTLTPYMSSPPVMHPSLPKLEPKPVLVPSYPSDGTGFPSNRSASPSSSSQEVQDEETCSSQEEVQDQDDYTEPPGGQQQQEKVWGQGHYTSPPGGQLQEEQPDIAEIIRRIQEDAKRRAAETMRQAMQRVSGYVSHRDKAQVPACHH